MSVQRDRINQSRINAGLTPLPETYTLRVMHDGAVLREQTGLDLEDGEREYVKTQKFYLNLPNPEAADRTTVQLFRESDGHVEHEITFWTPDAVDDLTEMQFHSL